MIKGNIPLFTCHPPHQQYATKSDETGEKFMTYSDLILRYLQLLDPEDYDPFTLEIFATTVDTSRDGWVIAIGFQ